MLRASAGLHEGFAEGTAFAAPQQLGVAFIFNGAEGNYTTWRGRDKDSPSTVPIKDDQAIGVATWL